MLHDFILSTKTAVQMADLLKLLARNSFDIVPNAALKENPVAVDIAPDAALKESPVAKIIPEQTEQQKQPSPDEVRDTSGMLYDPAIHSTKHDGTPAIKSDGTFKNKKTRRKIKTTPETDNSTPELKTDDLSGDKNRPQLYVCRDANSHKFPGSTVSTSREFVTVLVDQLKAVRDEKVHGRIIAANKEVLSRLQEDGEEKLLAEIDDYANG